MRLLSPHNPTRPRYRCARPGTRGEASTRSVTQPSTLHSQPCCHLRRFPEVFAQEDPHVSCRLRRDQWRNRFPFRHPTPETGHLKPTSHLAPSSNRRRFRTRYPPPPCRLRQNQQRTPVSILTPVTRHLTPTSPCRLRQPSTYRSAHPASRDLSLYSLVEQHSVVKIIPVPPTKTHP